MGSIPARARPGGGPPDVPALTRTLSGIRDELVRLERRVPLERFGSCRESARNLLHYIAFRRFDLRRVQDALADLGLSSLGRAESHVLYNLDSVLARLQSRGFGRPAPIAGRSILDPQRGRRLLARNATRLFGPPPAGRATRIMVTLPTEAAERPAFLRELLESGADCFRINCAHDSPREWERMLRHLHRAERALGRRARVEMDFGGPRLRTGPIEPGPALLKVRPTRDSAGHVLRPARVRLVSAASAHPAPNAEPELVVPLDWIRRRRRQELLRLRDARGARRRLRVESSSGKELIVSVEQTTSFSNGLSLVPDRATTRADRARVGGVPPRPGRIRLGVGDRLRLMADPLPGLGRRRGPGGGVSAARIGVSLPEVLGRVRKGDRVWFDGGRLGGVVATASAQVATVRIDRAPPGGAWLRGDQGINLPDTELGLPGLTEVDRAELEFIAGHADLVGYSYVRSGSDLEHLRAELRRLGRPGMGIVLKIETRRAFEELPAILLSALRSGPAAVMVARGDLAVEVGFERLAEVQEEILWLSEAAHLPTIWATDVLEGLARSGIPSRAEVTDAAEGQRAECVMLNKGPYLARAVRALDSIVRRMQAHQEKKTARLRHLNVAERFLEESRAQAALAAP